MPAAIWKLPTRIASTQTDLIHLAAANHPVVYANQHIGPAYSDSGTNPNTNLSPIPNLNSNPNTNNNLTYPDTNPN